MIRSFADLLAEVAEHPVLRVAVAAAAEESVLRAVADAMRSQIAVPVLFGDGVRIRDMLAACGLPSDVQVVDAADEVHAAHQAVQFVSSGQADVLMKGQIHTDDFLRAVLDKEHGLRAGVAMSHVFVLELPAQQRLLFVTDAAMNIAPNLERKAEIVLNAVYLARLLGYERPRVACVAAVELVNPAMPATVDAAVLAKMAERGQFPDCVIDGPLGMDNAVSMAAAATKRIGGEVAGRADILLMPDIETGNVMAKTFTHLGGGRLAGVLVGASAPVVLTSRADSAECKTLSIATAVLMAGLARTGKLKIGRTHY